MNHRRQTQNSVSRPCYFLRCFVAAVQAGESLGTDGLPPQTSTHFANVQKHKSDSQETPERRAHLPVKKIGRLCEEHPGSLPTGTAVLRK